MVNVRLVGSEAGSYHALAVDSQVIKNRARLWLRSERAMGLDRVPAAPKPADAAPEEVSGTAAAPAPAAKAAPAVSLPVDPVLPPSAPLPEAPLSREQKIAMLAQMEEQEVRNCVRCGLSRGRKHTVFGEGDPDAQLMFIGEGPGDTEDRTGRPFVGPSGKFLDSMLAEIGLDRAAAFIANVNRCRPPENRDPTSQEVAACHPWLAAQIRVIGPKVICPLGRFALEALVDPRLKISQVHGQPVERDGILYIPLYHPAAALHRQDLRDTLRADMRRVREILVERGL